MSTDDKWYGPLKVDLTAEGKWAIIEGQDQRFIAECETEEQAEKLADALRKIDKKEGTVLKYLTPHEFVRGFPGFKKVIDRKREEESTPEAKARAKKYWGDCS